MKRVFNAFFFCLLLPLSLFAGNEADWVSYLRKLSVQDGSEDNRGMGGALQLFADLDAPKVSGIITTYDLAAQIADAYPEKKAAILNLIFRHFDIWLQRHPTEAPSPEELKTLLGFVRRIEGDRQPVDGDENSKSLDQAFEVSMKVAFLRCIRQSVNRASGIPDILDAEFPRSFAGASFRRQLCALAVDRFVALNPLLKDIRRMIGHVGVNADLATQRGEFLGSLREASLRSLEESAVRNQRRVGRFARAENWMQEGEILLLVLLAGIEFKSEADLLAVYNDIIEQFSKAEANLGLPHGRAILLHYLYFLKRVRGGDYAPLSVLATLDFPGLLLKGWHLGNGTLPHSGEEFAIDPSQKWGSRTRVANHLEAATRARLKKVTSIDEVLNRKTGILQFSAFPSLDMEEAKWNAMIGFVPKFTTLNPSFQQLVNYLALVPRANILVISQMWKAESGSKDSTAAKLARVLIGLAKTQRITSDKTDDPLHREAILLMGRLLLLHSLKAEEVFSDDLPVLLQTALGEDFARLKKTKAGFIYRDFWSQPGVSKLVALAKACGLASTRYPYPPL